MQLAEASVVKMLLAEASAAQMLFAAESAVQMLLAAESAVQIIMSEHFLCACFPTILPGAKLSLSTKSNRNTWILGCDFRFWTSSARPFDQK